MSPYWKNVGEPPPPPPPPPPPHPKLLPARLCYDLRAQGHNLLYRQTMWFIKKILRRIVCFRPKNTKNFGSLAISIAFSWFSGFLVGVKKKSDAKVWKFWLARNHFWVFLASFWFLVWFHTPKYQKFRLARNQYSFFMSFWFSGGYKKKYICFWRKSTQICSQPFMVFSRVSGKFLVGINRHEQETKNSTFPLIIHIIHKQVFNRVISLYSQTCIVTTQGKQQKWHSRQVATIGRLAALFAAILIHRPVMAKYVHVHVKLNHIEIL